MNALLLWVDTVYMYTIYVYLNHFVLSALIPKNYNVYSDNLFNNMRCLKQIHNHRGSGSKYVVMFYIILEI